MAKRAFSALRLASFLQVCISASAFQVPFAGPLPAPRVHPAPSAGPTTPATLRVDSSLVLIPVHVTAATGAPIMGLKREDFALFQDGVRQTITHFTQDDAPVSAGLLLDISGSMKGKMAKAAAAAGEFFQSAIPEDEFFLLEFNGRPRIKVPFTRDWQQIADEITRAKASGMTALLDAVNLAAKQMKQARNTRKALIILSDGGDNYSHRSLRQLRSTLIESDLQVYVLGLYDNDFAEKHASEERRGPGLLDTVAQDTGGRDFPIAELEVLPAVGLQLSRELRSQYVLGFSPTDIASDGKYHQVKLKLMPVGRGGLHTYYRRGFYAPAQ